MGKINIRTSANLRSLDELQRKIERGIDAASEEIERDIKRTAKQHIRARDAMWTRELLNSFHSETVQTGKVQRTEIVNTSEHAPYVERGARYSVKKPPLEALIPWVESKLSGYYLTTTNEGETVLRPMLAD